MPSVDEQVIDFYYELFDRIFTQPFRPKIKERLRQDAVGRQVQEAAGAASQALTRFFHSEQLTEPQVAKILGGFTSLYELIKLDDIANPNRTPEALVEELLNSHPCPTAVSQAGSDAVYRVALHLTVQVLMLVGPVMTEWQRLSFSSTYEMPRQIVSQLNQITEGLKALAGAGQAAADERYELAYRDHLLQRFYRVEAGTVRMTTNLNVDLRELFVMPRLTVRPRRKTGKDGKELDAEALMNLTAARAVFGEDESPEGLDVDNKAEGVFAIEQVRRAPRSIVVGVPGGGKSTFFEWLQLSVANVDEELMSGGGQAIPLLLRVRQLDPKNLPRGADLIEKATASRDRATLMPEGWIHRQMKAGRILLMLDGLDETEPGLRDDYILPWLNDLCKQYPDCLYLVASRPVGYPPGLLRKLKFAECDLQDFREAEIAEYTRHWCTAIRLAQNDLDEEARREGTREGEQIVAGFKDHPYIRNLARNPLMLSAICLVNYFEGGQLPKDRAVLYKLCVEGLLHHWDQRRGIHSEYSLDEKLRLCREVAIAMQADDRAEYEAAKVLEIFTNILKNADRAKKLLEHIRYRTGLLIERRASVFAFAHLTFQEYLAARAVYEGNDLGIDVAQLSREHHDGRWNEVIALYCGSAPAKDARQMIENLIKQSDSSALSGVLAEAFLSSRTELSQDAKFRKKVLERIAVAPYKHQLKRFNVTEVVPIANRYVGRGQGKIAVTESFIWLMGQPDEIDFRSLMNRLKKWSKLTPELLYELHALVHRWGLDRHLLKLVDVPSLYAAPGPRFSPNAAHRPQADDALSWLSARADTHIKEIGLGLGAERALLQSLRVIAGSGTVDFSTRVSLRNLFRNLLSTQYPRDTKSWPEFIALTRQLADYLKKDRLGGDEEQVLRNWASQLERRLTGMVKQQARTERKSKSKPPPKRAPSSQRSRKKLTRRGNKL